MPYMVMVRCPTADTAVPTGVTCDLPSFAKLATQSELRCPKCGDVHVPDFT